MEYGINLKAKPTAEYSVSMTKLIKSLVGGNKDNVVTALNDMSLSAIEKYTKISTHDYYSSYLTYLDKLDFKKINDVYSLDITTGSFGYEFAIALVDLLGPYCEKITAYVTHDEDFGHIPIKITHHHNTVFADGEKVSVLVIKEEEINLWAIEPWVDSNTLEAISTICKKAKSIKDFTQLSLIYSELFKPIVTLAESYELSSELLSTHDEAEYLVYINGVIDLEINKTNHLVIDLFQIKMRENLDYMMRTNYLGSIFEEYKKTLLVFYTFYDLHNNKKSDETLDEFIEEIIDYEEFELIYQATALLEFGIV